MNTGLIVFLVFVGAVILVAALKAALGPDNKQHGQSDSGTGVGVSYHHHAKHDDNDGDGDSGDDGGGGD